MKCAKRMLVHICWLSMLSMLPTAKRRKKERKKEKEEKGTLFKKIKKERGLLVQPLVCVFFKSTTVVKVESEK